MKGKITFENVIHAMAAVAVIVMIVFTIVNCDENNGGNGYTNGIGSLSEIVIGNFSWHVYSDYNEGGKSTIKMEKIDTDKIAFKGSVGFIEESAESIKHYGFAAAEADPNNNALNALKASDYFTFKHKGDGNDYQVVVITKEIKDGNYFYTTFSTSSTAGELKVYYTDLERDVIGDYEKINPENILCITFQAIADLDEGAFSFTIWDLEPGISIVEQKEIEILKMFKEGKTEIYRNLLVGAKLIEDQTRQYESYLEYLRYAYYDILLSEGSNMNNLSELYNEDSESFNLDAFIIGIKGNMNINLENLTFEQLVNKVEEWKVKLAEFVIAETVIVDTIEVSTNWENVWTNYWADFFTNLKNENIAAAP